MDFEEMLQRGLAEKSERNKRSLAGGRGSDSDSYDEADIDDGFDDIGSSDLLLMVSAVFRHNRILKYIMRQ